MSHTVPFTLTLSVWVPIGVGHSWRPCTALGNSLTDELIQSCTELTAVMSAHSRLIARILSAPAVPRYEGFRLIGRHADTRVLVAVAEWTRSHETHELVPFPCPWTSCRYEHPLTTLVA